MSGYKSIKRVLGETSLERKCRLLFGACLLVLVCGTFYWVDQIAEGLVLESTRSKGRDLVDIAMLKLHFEGYETNLSLEPFVKSMTDALEHQTYDYEVLSLSNDTSVRFLPANVPRDPKDLEMLHLLKAQLEKEEADAKQSEAAASAQSGSAADANTEGQAIAKKKDWQPLNADRRHPAEDEYLYYEPIYWNADCKHCHSSAEIGTVPAALGSTVLEDEAMFRVVKVSIPYEETQAAINRARALLIGVAIFTIFAAMIALYVVVRYVIVKPLKHLRDVSDDISRGKKEMRAEIHTNDEFEELADSFNRMLRHLTDTEADLRKVNAELDGKVDELAQLNMRLHEMNRVKSEFLANMSHELRTPLNSIIGFSEVLQGIESLSDKQKRYAGNIQKSGRTLLEMINDILDVAKMEAGKMDVRLSEFSIASIVSAQCDMVRALTEEKNIDLEVCVEAGNPPLYQDQAKVQQILTNLLSNAIKFTPEGGRITVSARGDVQGRLELVVADDGVGIAEEDREVIFEKFRQGPTSSGADNLTREYSGTGLGLSIVKELCKLLGGSVSFESELGKGSTFKVALPWRLSVEPHYRSEFNARIDEVARPQSIEPPRPRQEPPPHSDVATVGAAPGALENGRSSKPDV